MRERMRENMGVQIRKILNCRQKHAHCQKITPLARTYTTGPPATRSYPLPPPSRAPLPIGHSPAQKVLYILRSTAPEQSRQKKEQAAKGKGKRARAHVLSPPVLAPWPIRPPFRQRRGALGAKMPDPPTTIHVHANYPITSQLRHPLAPALASLFPTCQSPTASVYVGRPL